MTFFFQFCRRFLRFHPGLALGIGDPVTIGKVVSGSAMVGDAGIGDTRGAGGAAVDSGEDVKGAAEE